MIRNELEPGQPNVIDQIQELDKIKPEWDALYLSSQPFHPFGFYGVLKSWWNNFGLSQDDRLHISTFRNHIDGFLWGIIPQIEVDYGVIKKYPIWKALRPTGRVKKGIMVTEVKPGPIIAPGWEETMATAILRSNQNDYRHSWIDISSMPANFFDNQESDNRNHICTLENCYFFLSKPETVKELIGRFSRNSKKVLRKGRNRRENTGIVLETAIYNNPKEILSVLDRFFTLHEARAKMTGVLQHENYYPTPEHRQYLKDLVQELPPGVFRMAIGKINDKIQTMRMIFVFNDWLYLYDSGFNPDYWWYDIMQSLNINIIEHIMRDQKIKKVNLSVGKDHNKLSWNPEQGKYYNHRFTPPSVRAQILYRLAELVGKIRGRSI